jgi:hypothetical protein
MLLRYCAFTTLFICIVVHAQKLTTPRASFLDIPARMASRPAQQQRVIAWLDAATHQLLSYESSDGDLNNHHYWRALAAISIGVIRPNDFAAFVFYAARFGTAGLPSSITTALQSPTTAHPPWRQHHHPRRQIARDEPHSSRFPVDSLYAHRAQNAALCTRPFHAAVPRCAPLSMSTLSDPAPSRPIAIFCLIATP